MMSPKLTKVCDEFPEFLQLYPALPHFRLLQVQKKSYKTEDLHLQFRWTKYITFVKKPRKHTH